VESGSNSEEWDRSNKILLNDSEWNPKLDSSLTALDVVSNLRDAGHVQGQLLGSIVAGVKCSEDLANAERNSDADVKSNPCLVAANTRRSSKIERDFTTIGVQGSLRCPFAKPANGHEPADGVPDGQNVTAKTTCEYDPISVDLGQDHISSAGHSARSSAARCPIRYMDQHSPEEIAKYFENHKHEIPRSHAICVTRFQRNGESMRQIDEKYGSLVNMIQGLGQKHKPLLPGQGHEEFNENVSTSADRVEKWAEDVSTKSTQPAPLDSIDEGTQEEPESVDRTGRFERNLREVRVGESPSRPWGIPVPISHEPPFSAVPSPEAPVRIPASELQKQTTSDEPSGIAPQHASPTPARPTGKCPFDHKALLQSTKAPKDEALSAHPEVVIADDKAKVSASDTRPREPTSDTAKASQGPVRSLIFNGPVFFGYSAEEAAALMQQLGSRATDQ
jgi:hypothetical protein